MCGEGVRLGASVEARAQTWVSGVRVEHSVYEQAGRETGGRKGFSEQGGRQGGTVDQEHT